MKYSKDAQRYTYDIEDKSKKIKDQNTQLQSLKIYSEDHSTTDH